MATYMWERRADRRARLHALLGSACSECGATSELEFHHLDPKIKSFTIGTSLDGPWSRLLDEAKKCVLLCASCHHVETAAQSTVGHGGGETGVRNCYCDSCRPLKRKYMTNYVRPSRRKEP